MGHEQLKHIKDNLMYAIEGQMCNLYECDVEELGEAIDMLKDLEEALYFCTITEAMTGKGKGEYNVEVEHESKGGKQNGREQFMYYTEPYYNYNYPSYRDEGPMMYYNGGGRGGSSSGGGGNFGSSGGSSSSSGGGGGSSSSNFSEPMMMMKDYREGRSPQSRKMYLEAKEQKGEKSSQLKELERYMQELSQDMVDMIQESTPEEKQYLEKKISALATKIGQMK